MNHKKIFFSVIIVVLTATMSVGFTSCNDEIEVPEPDYSEHLIGKWKCVPWDSPGYYIEFKDDGAYSYENPEQGSGDGNYRVIKTVLDQEVKLANRDGDPVKATLLVIEVSPNDVFDRIAVYYFHSKNMAVEYFSRDQLLTDFVYTYHFWW